MQEISQEIISQAAQGDLKAFEAIYKETSSFVYNVAFRVVGNKEDAQEVVQEVFLTVHQKLKEFRFQSSFKTWIYRVTANQAINMAKKTSKTKNKTFEYDEQVHPVAVAADVEAKIEKEHQEGLIEELLNSINPDQRACVVLRNIEGLSYEEIATTLKLNINTVRTRLKRAREKMLLLKKQVGYVRL
jgi:RNA polymerase sigma-70 factor (ECF subfamily)